MSGNGADPFAEATAQANTNGWEPPVEFPSGTYGPPVPIEAVPVVLAEHASSVAASVKVPLDLMVGGVLGATAAAAARRAEVAIGGTHVEPLNLYVMPIAPPGERKPAVIRQTIFPLEDEERSVDEAGRIERARTRQGRAVELKRIERLQAEGAKEKNGEKRRAIAEEAALLEAALPGEPVEPRLLIDDATPEYLVKMLAEQGGRLMVASEEAGSLVSIAAGLYSRNGDPNLDALLKAYDGGRVRVGRVSRAEVFVERAALSILVTAQPAVLDRIALHDDLRGRGFVGRVAFVVPPSLVGTRIYQDLGIDQGARRRYADTLAAIMRLPTPKLDEIPRLVLAGDALDVWRVYADEIEREQAIGRRLAHVCDWASKHAGRVARIAGLFHLVTEIAARRDPFAVPITAETVAAAWVVGEWLTEHALAAFGTMGANPTEALARKVLSWIRRERLAGFSERDCYRAHRDVDTRERFRPALDVLEDRGFVRLANEVPREGRPGRPPSPRYDVNPATHQADQQGNSVDSVRCAPGGVP